jgi:hypothetical protein
MKDKIKKDPLERKARVSKKIKENKIQKEEDEELIEKYRHFRGNIDANTSGLE